MKQMRPNQNPAQYLGVNNQAGFDSEDKGVKAEETELKIEFEQTTTGNARKQVESV